eukprot:4354245-Pleurochrysis_carterae.AAC.1
MSPIASCDVCTQHSLICTKALPNERDSFMYKLSASLELLKLLQQNCICYCQLLTSSHLLQDLNNAGRSGRAAIQTLREIGHLPRAEIAR